MMTKDRARYLCTEIAAANLFLGLVLAEGIDLRDDTAPYVEMKSVLRAGDRAAHELEDISLRDLLSITVPEDASEIASTALAALMQRRKLIRKINLRDQHRPIEH